jgi:glycosyltransferase involved in cell wall biosynthesis
VPPADPQALRAAIQRMLDNPAQAAEIGAAARRFIEENAGLDLFVKKTVAALKTGDELRRAS